jgi:hypothetical protein
MIGMGLLMKKEIPRVKARKYLKTTYLTIMRSQENSEIINLGMLTSS